MTTHHTTLTFDRPLKAAPSRVWTALADPEARAIWGPPSEDMNMVFQEADFRAGGRDVCVCGPGPAEGVIVETFYHAIEEETRLIFTEVIGMPGAPEAVSLVTTTLTPSATGTDLKVILQLSSLHGPEMEQELKGGWGSSLENLAGYLEEREARQPAEQ